MVICSVCGKNQATFFQKHSGRRLCRECFINDIRYRVKEQISRYSMISSGDRVVVGVSGGKDSYVVLHILSEIVNPNNIIGVMIDEGIAGYTREDMYIAVRKFCSDIGVDCIYVSMEKILDFSVDRFMRFYLEYAKENNMYSISACTYCGIARRRILNMYARELKANKVVTGHNLDDEIQTYIINIIRGDVMRLAQLHPLSETHSDKLVKRVKPLRSIYEYESAYYAYLLGYTFQEYECPYIVTRPTLRTKVRDVLIELEKLYPGVQLKLLEFLDNTIANILVKPRIALPTCKICGEPTSPNRSICKFCELVEDIKKILHK
ncbi:MAG: TIGR00269 family protein [Ignisphaera sp.]